MVIRAVQQANPPSDAETGITEEILINWRERVLEWQRRDSDRALAFFTFVADVTTLAEDCRFAGDSETLVARYDGLPFAAIAFHHGTLSVSGGRTSTDEDSSVRVAALTRRLMAPGKTFTCLVAEDVLPLLRSAYEVLDVHPEWQMLFRAHPSGLNPGDAVALGLSQLPEMRALARREGMQAFDREPLSRGPWYGVWRDGKLVAQGGTHLLLDRAAEIGNVVTATGFRGRGYGSQVVAALVQDFAVRDYLIFLHVLKDNEAAVAFYEKLGFERHRTMFLARCRLGAW